MDTSDTLKLMRIAHGIGKLEGIFDHWLVLYDKMLDKGTEEEKLKAREGRTMTLAAKAFLNSWISVHYGC